MEKGAIGAFTLSVITLGIAASIPDAAWGPSFRTCILHFMGWGTRARAEVKAPCTSGDSFAKCPFAFLARGKEEPGKKNPPQELSPPVCAKKGSEDEALLVGWGAVLPGVVVAFEECAGRDRTERDVRAVQEFRTR